MKKAYLILFSVIIFLVTLNAQTKEASISFNLETHDFGKIKEADATMPVILSSAYQEFKQDLSSWASDDFVVKSADMSELIKSVFRHVRD